MRYFPLFLLLAFVGLSLPACAQKTTPRKVSAKKISKKAVARQSTAPAKTEIGPVLTFERTPCFGTCPGYVMQVFADGRVAYEGRRAVPIMGKKDLKLPAAAVAEMLRQTKEAGFDQFQDQYTKNVSDLPSVVVGVRQPNGQLKIVVVEYGAPDNVQALITSLGNQFDALAQLGGVDK